jgi:hypothetical protein
VVCLGRPLFWGCWIGLLVGLGFWGIVDPIKLSRGGWRALFWLVVVLLGVGGGVVQYSGEEERRSGLFSPTPHR